MQEKTFEKLFQEIEKVKNNKNALYTIKPYEKYKALTVKQKGLEKLAKTFANYKPKNEKEKAYVEFITTCTYYGKDKVSMQDYVLELLNA